MKTDQELKTLKDLRKESTNYGDGWDIEPMGDWVELEELKAEAVKWVKFYRRVIKEKKKYQKDYGCLDDDIIKLNIKCEVFIDFFNLTEEDMKNDRE